MINYKMEKINDSEDFGGTKIMFLTAEMGDKLIFFHEAVWAKEKGLIPKGELICHVNGKTDENNIENLFSVDEKKVNGSDRLTKDKVFHEDSYDEEFVKEHFNDVYNSLNRIKVEEMV